MTISPKLFALIWGCARLYQMVRQQGAIRDRTFEIEFFDPGAQAFAFTFTFTFG
jgi:hypothetical protein